ncbi:MAG: hypothetical protein Q7R45_00060, partial [Sulfuricaulis sp.]|nr:hypothetical protein [Sulfuricaulis sp.]
EASLGYSLKTDPVSFPSASRAFRVCPPGDPGRVWQKNGGRKIPQPLRPEIFLPPFFCPNHLTAENAWIAEIQIRYGLYPQSGIFLIGKSGRAPPGGSE